MYIPTYWARAQGRGLTALGWSDESVAEAEKLARERLAKAAARRGGAGEWDYYPARPVKEEILESPAIPGIRVVVTRNRVGAQVLNADRVAFIDVDLPDASAGRAGCLGSLLGSPVAPKKESTPDDALSRARAWAVRAGAILRAYRTAGGLRLLRLDRLMDPADAETQRMFAELGADPQYQRLCKLQKSFRARLTPKPYRVGCRPSPGSHPRTDPAAQQAFARWLAKYAVSSASRSVCAPMGDLGSGTPVEPARQLAEWHDRRTIREGAPLA